MDRKTEIQREREREREREEQRNRETKTDGVKGGGQRTARKLGRKKSSETE